MHYSKPMQCLVHELAHYGSELALQLLNAALLKHISHAQSVIVMQ